MKTLNQFIKESLLCKAIYNESILDDEEDLINNSHIEIIEKFIKDNYKVAGKLNIKEVDNKYIVDYRGNVEVSNIKIEQLTNGFFEWGKVGGFSCSFCESLKSLQGAPKEVGRDFSCSSCKSLTSLQGAPERVGGSFSCSYCESLTSLEGAPEKVDGYFNCGSCTLLTSLQGAPEKVGGCFYCFECKSLTSLEDAPEKVGGSFDCRKCGIQFTKEDIEKVSKVRGKIFI